MKSTEIQPVPIEELSNLFYELEFASKENKHQVLREISTIIPWQHSVFDVIDNLKDPVLRSTSRCFARLIQTERTYHRLKRIAQRPLSRTYEDLEEGVFLISELGDSQASYIELKNYLDRVAERVEELFEENFEILSDESKVQILIRVLVEEEGFYGNEKYYDDPSNSFINQVIKTKMGIPISLSAIFILVGKRLGLPIYGTNMPFHFLLLYDSPDYTTYIDPYNSGILLDRTTCERFLETHGFEPTQKYFARASTSSIIRRMFRNLINIYRKKGYREMEELLNIYLQVMDKKR
ncbi:MAG: transglutaminase family protein [Leptospira sp.]|nr:transglutaminase family protein [Leptospira sp.]